MLTCARARARVTLARQAALTAANKFGTRDEDALHCEGFALAVFGRAAKVDLAGKATLTTAKAFVAAARFFEVLLHFGDLREDIQEKMKYAAWKAADIQAALREGRQPMPGGVVPLADDEEDAVTAGAVADGAAQDPGDALPDLPSLGDLSVVDDAAPLPSPEAAAGGAPLPQPPPPPAVPSQPAPPAAPPSIPPAAAYPPPIVPSAPPMQPPPAPAPSHTPLPAQAATVPAAPPTAVPGFAPSRKAVDDAQKACRVAVSALGFDDVESAVESLHAALALLTRPS